MFCTLKCALCFASEKMMDFAACSVCGHWTDGGFAGTVGHCDNCGKELE